MKRPFVVIHSCTLFSDPAPPALALVLPLSCKPGALPRIHTVTSSLSRMLVCRIHSKSDAAPQRRVRTKSCVWFVAVRSAWPPRGSPYHPL